MKDDAERARSLLAHMMPADRLTSLDERNAVANGGSVYHPTGDVIRAMIAFAQQQEGWRPIETAPKDGSTVDLWQGGERWPDCYWEGGMWWGGCLQNPTHWRQPPAPPAAMLDVAPIPGEE